MFNLTAQLNARVSFRTIPEVGSEGLRRFQAQAHDKQLTVELHMDPRCSSSDSSLITAASYARLTAGKLFFSLRAWLKAGCPLQFVGFPPKRASLETGVTGVTGPPLQLINERASLKREPTFGAPPSEMARKPCPNIGGVQQNQAVCETPRFPTKEPQSYSAENENARPPGRETFRRWHLWSGPWMRWTISSCALKPSLRGKPGILSRDPSVTSFWNLQKRRSFEGKPPLNGSTFEGQALSLEMMLHLKAQNRSMDQNPTWRQKIMAA